MSEQKAVTDYYNKLVDLTLGHVPADELAQYKNSWSLSVEALRLHEQEMEQTKSIRKQFADNISAAFDRSRQMQCQKEANIIIVPPAMFERLNQLIPGLKYTQSPFNTYAVDYTQVSNGLCKIGLASLPDSEPPLLDKVSERMDELDTE